MITVVIPLYNKAETISRTVRSVLAQDGPDFEVVVVNDGSTDDGADIVAGLGDPRIRIVDQTNQGVSAARNKGVEVARNELIAFLDGDDYFLPGYLAGIAAAAQRFPAAAMYCGAGFVHFPDGSEFVRSAPKYSAGDRVVDYFENPYFFTHTSATVVRRTQFFGAGGFPIGMADNEDLVLFFKLALQFDVVFCPAPLSVYNFSPSRRKVRLQDQGLLPTDAGDIDLALIDRYNAVYRFSSGLGRNGRTSSFLAFTSYDLCSHVFGAFKAGDHSGAAALFHRIDPDLVAELNPFKRSTCKAMARTASLPASAPSTRARISALKFTSKLWIRLSRTRRQKKGYPEIWVPVTKPDPVSASSSDC